MMLILVFVTFWLLVGIGLPVVHASLCLPPEEVRRCLTRVYLETTMIALGVPALVYCGAQFLWGRDVLVTVSQGLYGGNLWRLPIMALTLIFGPLTFFRVDRRRSELDRRTTKDNDSLGRGRPAHLGRNQRRES
jgi:hypothetical protein